MVTAEATWGDGTRCVRAGVPAPAAGAPLLPGPVFAAPYHLDGPPAGPDTYARAGNPTWRALEQAIGELDGGTCVLFPSGMGAIGVLLRCVLGRGDVLVLPADGYFVVRSFVREELAPLGLEVREVPTAGPWPEEVFDGARLVLLETPSNPGMDICDISELARRAHAHGALVAVDNTTATPLGQRPLDLGADVTVASDTKALTGHSDLVLGHVCTRDGALAQRLVRARTLGGVIPAPFETWLAHRSLGTLDLRLARQADNARALALALRGHPMVRWVRWPGLPDDPGYEIAARQMRRFGGVLSVELPDAVTVDSFVRRSTLISAATSFGGLHTTADRRAQWGDPVPHGLVRLSAGCEDAADLVADVLQALA